MDETRLRIRRLDSILPKHRPKTHNRYWAWSRPHVAEEIGRIGDSLRRNGPMGLVKEIHSHPLDADCPVGECLLVDTTLAIMPIGADEVVVK